MATYVVANKSAKTEFNIPVAWQILDKGIKFKSDK